MRIAVFAPDQNPDIDRPFVRKSRAYVKELLAQFKANILDGKNADCTLRIQLCAPVEEMSGPQTVIQAAMGWSVPNDLRDCALNRGRSGQGVANYPVPFVYEGRMKRMRVAQVNA